MRIIHYQDPGEFQKDVLDALVQHEAENNLLLGILAQLIAGEFRDNPPYLAVFENGGEMQAISVCTPPWPALVSYQNPPPGAKTCKAMLEDMRGQLQEDFTGLSGNRKFVSRLVSHWEEGSGKKAILKMAQRIYQLEEVQPVSGVPGRMRPAEDNDRDLLKGWFAGFQRDALNEAPDLARVQKQVNTYLTADPQIRGLMIWEIGDQPVSMAGYAGPTPNGIRVGAVYTPPGLRRNGYASAVTAGISQSLLGQGYRFCFLFTDLLNPTSNHIYRQIGYQPVCDGERYLFV